MRFLSATLAAAFALAACGPTRPPITPDLEPPYVLGVDPAGNNVPVDAVFTVRFSEPIQANSVFWLDASTEVQNPDAIVIAAAEDEDYVVSAVANPPLSTTQRGKTVPCVVTLSDDRTQVELRPLSPLEGLKSYVIVASRKLKDDANNKLVDPETKANDSHVARFTTQGAPDLTRPTAILKAPAPGATGVAVDIPQVEVQFSEPMDKASASPGSVSITDVESHQKLATRDAHWSEDVLVIELEKTRDIECATLCPGRVYTLTVSPDVTDLAGNPVELVDGAVQRFTAATCADSAAPQLAADSVTAEPTDRSAVVGWTTDEPSSSTVEFVSCGGGTCPAPVTGEDASCTADVCHLPTDPASFECPHTVKLAGLAPATDYVIRVVSVDGGGRRTASSNVSFRTLEPLPKLVLNEVFASPVGLSDANAGKFVEILNAGTAPVDLAPTGSGSSRKAWALARCSEATCTGPLSNVWPMKPSGTTTAIPAGGFALAVGNAFDAAKMGVPASAVMLKNDGTSTTVLSNGLTSTTAYAYALLAPGGLIVSTYGAHFGKPNATANNGHAFERKSAAGDDAAANWSLSTTAVPGAAGNFATPGARNSSGP